MKKLLGLLLALLVLCTFAACGGNEEAPAEEPAPTEEATEAPEETEEPEEAPDVEEEEEEELPEEEPEPANENAIVGPATASKGNVSFELPEGWSFEESDSTISAIQIDGAIVLVQGPLERRTEDLTGDITVNIDVMMMTVAISGFTDNTQNEQRFSVNDMQYPAVSQIYLAQIGGEWRNAHSILFFGEEETFIVHMIDIDSADDFFEAVYLPFLQSIAFG